MDDAPIWLDPRDRPAGVADATVAATGKLGEAVEWIERARGRLYDFHQMSGHADLLMGEAADALDEAGHGSWADRLRAEIIGRNVLDGRWTFQVVEEYEGTYWEPVRALRAELEADLVAGLPHLYESEMKEERRSHGARHHERRPASGG